MAYIPYMDPMGMGASRFQTLHVSHGAFTVHLLRHLRASAADHQNLGVCAEEGTKDLRANDPRGFRGVSPNKRKTIELHIHEKKGVDSRTKCNK
jgi:hypothetical protein